MFATHRTPNVRAYVRNVYMLLGVSAGAVALGGMGAAEAGMGAATALAVGMFSYAPLLAAFYRSQDPMLWRYTLLLTGAAMVGVGISPLFSYVGLPIDWLSFGGLVSIFAGFWLAALMAPSGTSLRIGGVTLTVLLFGIFAGLGPMIGVPAHVFASLDNFNLYAGLAFTSLYVTWDTKYMIKCAAAGESDHIWGAGKVFQILVQVLPIQLMVIILLWLSN